MVDTGEIMEKVNALVDGSGLTIGEIARRCGESEQKIRRTLEGKNPSFAPLCGIITACGGSVDEIIGAMPSVNGKTYTLNEPLVRAYEARIKSLNKWAKTGWILFALFAFVVLIILVVDLLNPNIGWFRSAAMQAYYSTDATSTIIQALHAVFDSGREFIL